MANNCSFNNLLKKVSAIVKACVASFTGNAHTEAPVTNFTEESKKLKIEPVQRKILKSKQDLEINCGNLNMVTAVIHTSNSSYYSSSACFTCTTASEPEV